MALEFVEAGIYFAVVESLCALADRLEEQRLRVELRINAQDVENDTRSRAIVATADDVAIADDEDELALVVVLKASERVDRAPERFFALRVTRDLAQDELVLQLRILLATELQRRQDYDNGQLRRKAK